MRDGEWDLVILDWWLPGQDGLEVLRGYRHEGGTTPVLFLTARDAVSDRVRGLDGGADDYLCKPFAFDELLARTRALIRRGRPVEVMTLSYRDLRVDLAAQEGRADRPSPGSDDQGTGLTRLLPPPSRRNPLSRTRIYGHVWGEDLRLRLQNTLDVHIGRAAPRLPGGAGTEADPDDLGGRGYLLGDPPATAAEESP